MVVIAGSDRKVVFQVSKPEAYIYVQKDGVPLHRHPGHPKLHGPWEEHGSKARTAKLHAHPLLVADYAKLTVQQKADYDSGEDLSKRWLARYKTEAHKLNEYRPRPGGRNARVLQGLSPEELAELGDPAGFVS